MSFQKEETEQKVVEIIAEKLSIPKENIKSSATFKDIGADSLDSVELMMAFEDSFGIEIKDEDAEKIQTIQNAIDLIHDNRKK
jgi:acyl carrier protein